LKRFYEQHKNVFKNLSLLEKSSKRPHILCLNSICENIGNKSKFCEKVEILEKNGNFERKSKFLEEIKILGKDRNFEQKFWKKWKFWEKIEILGTNRNFGENLNFVNIIAQER